MLAWWPWVFSASPGVSIVPGELSLGPSPRQRISESQRQFLLDGVQQNLRSDGRGPFDYRRDTWIDWEGWTCDQWDLFRWIKRWKRFGLLWKAQKVVILLCFFLVQKFEILLLVLSVDFFAFCWPLPSNRSKSLHQVIFELNAIPTCTSSCRLRAGETEVLIALKCPISQLEWEEWCNFEDLVMFRRFPRLGAWFIVTYWTYLPRWWQLKYFLFSSRPEKIIWRASIFFKWVGEKPPTSYIHIYIYMHTYL